MSHTVCEKPRVPVSELTRLWGALFVLLHVRLWGAILQVPEGQKKFFGSPQPADILMKTPVAVSPEKNYYTERRSVPAGYRDADGSLAQAEVG